MAEPNLVARRAPRRTSSPAARSRRAGRDDRRRDRSIQFKPFGISLKFRPTVLGENGIGSGLLRVERSRTSSSDDAMVGPHALVLTRRAETTSS
jgi:Flp pilus assembly secretin CpaC